MEDFTDIENLITAILAAAIVHRRAGKEPPNALGAASEFQNVRKELVDLGIIGERQERLP